MIKISIAAPLGWRFFVVEVWRKELKRLQFVIKVVILWGKVL